MRGIHYPNGTHTINPHKVVATLAERFAADGGTVVRGRVRGFRRDGNRVTAVQLTDSELPAKAVMIAAGRASGELTRLLGFNAPLVAERGYHVMVAPDNVRFDLPVSPPDRGLFFTPMAEGLRHRRHGRAGRAAPAALLASRRPAEEASQGRSSPASAAPSRAAGSASARPCPTTVPPSAARRVSPTSIAATATSISA